MARSCIFLSGSLVLVLGSLACDSGGTVNDGGSSSTSTTTVATTVTSTTGTTTSASSGGAGTTSTADSTVASTSSSGGSGGEGGAAPAGWPTCDSQPSGTTLGTIADIFNADPATPARYWVPGVYVTAVSHGGCTASTSCDIMVQQDETYGTIADSHYHSIRIGIAPAVSEHFVGIKVGDKVDVYGHFDRDTSKGLNELDMLVTPALRGCAKVVGSGNPKPVAATLDDLTVDNYDKYGPAFVIVTTVTGKPSGAGSTFAVWDTETGPSGSLSDVVSLSPYFIAGGSFTGLTSGSTTKFASVTGVFGLFDVQGNPPTLYKEIYIRTMADAPTL